MRKAFLSTLPARGATQGLTCFSIRSAFLSTLPARGATVVVVFKLVHFVISIHAPREGSDSRRAPLYRKAVWYFYPRSPRGERLHDAMIADKKRNISIHAPREGSDL